MTLVTDRSVQESTFGDVPFYVTTSGGVGVQHLFWNKLTANLRATVGQDKYPSKQTVNGQTDWRSDIFFTYGGGLDYDISRGSRSGWNTRTSPGGRTSTPSTSRTTSSPPRSPCSSEPGPGRQ